MALADRLKTLQLLERVSRHQLEVVGIRLSEIRSEQAGLRNKSEALNALALHEANISTPETRPNLPAFLASVDGQRRHWADEIETLEQSASKIEAELYDTFRDLKTKEIVTAKVETAIKVEEERNEMAAVDDAIRALGHLSKS